MAATHTADIADRLAIHDLLGRYAHAVDRQDFELARTCYHEDAYDDHGRFKGHRDDLIGYFHTLGPKLSATFHMMGLPYIIQRADRAWVITYAYYRRTVVGDDEAVAQGLRYLDYLEKRDGEWRIARRTVVLDWENALGPPPTVRSTPDWARGAYGEDDPATSFLREADEAD